MLENIQPNQNNITFRNLVNVPHVYQGDNLAEIIADSLEANEIRLEDKDIIAIAQKIVSKAEGRVFPLDTFKPSADALEIALVTGRDPKYVQAVLEESSEVIQIIPKEGDSRGRIITKDNRGFIGTSSGIDMSNVGDYEDQRVVLLPENPDLSAKRMVDYLYERYQIHVGVVIVDSMGDPNRLGSLGKAIGVANIPSRLITKGVDLYGKISTLDIALADSIAAFSMLMMGKKDAMMPVVHIRGLSFPFDPKATIRSALKNTPPK